MSVKLRWFPHNNQIFEAETETLQPDVKLQINEDKRQGMSQKIR